MEEKFNKKDIKQIQDKGILIEKIEQQLQFFINGIAKVNLEKSASINDGIMYFSVLEIEELCCFFDENKTNKSIQKFVPASGAASRMFKFLSEFLSEFDFDLLAALMLNQTKLFFEIQLNKLRYLSIQF